MASMLKKLFMRKKEEVIMAPITGKVLPLENVPDEVFSQKLVGDGLAIEPVEGTVVSPLDREVIQVFPTKHAIGIRGDNGLEVLIHIGLDTVELNGEGFAAHVEQNSKVQAGDPLISFELEKIKSMSYSPISPIIITNGEVVESMTKTDQEFVEKGKSVLIKVNKK